jgi:nitrate/nitrite-specific signal transduction histidine kinase
MTVIQSNGMAQPISGRLQRLLEWVISSQQSRYITPRPVPADAPEFTQRLLPDLACDISSCTQPATELATLLVPLQSWLQQQFHPTRPDSLLQALWLPGSQDNGYRCVMLANSAEITPVSDPVHVLLPAGHRMQSLTLKQGTAWLLVNGQHIKSRDQESLEQCLSLLGEQLSRGLNGWQQQQQRLQQALKDERQWHAAELHDSVAQVLGYLRMSSARLAKRCDNSAELSALLPEAQDLSEQCLFAYRQTRELIATSRLSTLASELGNELNQLVEEFEERSALVFELDNRCENLPLDDHQATQLLYIVRESVCNLVRHAHASHARIRLYQEADGTLVCAIEDNGRGIQAAANNGSFGLQIMQERAQRIGASLTIGSRQPSGTCVRLQLPLTHPLTQARHDRLAEPAFRK